jgi:hypothetical protein
MERGVVEVLGSPDLVIAQSHIFALKNQARKSQGQYNGVVNIVAKKWGQKVAKNI